MDDIYIHSNRVQSRQSLTALSGRLISELCELLGKLSRRCAFLLAKRYSISVRRSSGSAGGAPRGGGASCAGVESEESDDTGVADPHENLHKHKTIIITWSHRGWPRQIVLDNTSQFRKSYYRCVVSNWARNLLLGNPAVLPLGYHSFKVLLTYMYLENFN